MKKTKLLLALVASASLLAGCGKVETNYFGLGAVAYYENINEESTVYHVETTIDYVSVLVNAKGVVSKLRLDTTQVHVAADGEKVKLTSDKYGDNGDVKSKWDLLDEYGMKGLSSKIGIGKEWYEQAEAFENWAVGKDLATIKGSVGKDAYLIDGAAVGVSIHVSTWVEALEQALLNKIEVKGKVAAIGVGSKNSQHDLQSDFYVAGAAFTKDKKVLAGRVDCFQVPYKVAAGVATVDEAEKNVQIVAKDLRIRGKHEQKEDYGMKALSSKIGIGLEWYEQANNLAALLVGKTVSEALGTAESFEKEKATEVGVSITISGYRAVLLEAEHTAFTARY